MRKIIFILLCFVAVRAEAQVPGDNAITPEKKEDSAAGSGDPLIGIAARVNSGAATLAADGDYTTPAVNALGSTFIDANVLLQGSTALGLLKREDAASDDQGAGVASLIKLQSAITADAAAEDYGFIKGDTGGRLITTSAPSGEMLQGCSAEVTTVTTANIVNAVASKYNFMTGVTCTNTGAAATRVVIEDGDGVDMATLNLAATVGYATATFPSPGIRTNAVNKTIRTSVITTGSATICCISGFVGAI